MLIFCPFPGGTHLLCDPSSPLPVETGRLASQEGPGTWESRGKKMGGNESKTKTTVLENMIKNFKKGFDGDYRRKMTPGWASFPPLDALSFYNEHHLLRYIVP